MLRSILSDEEVDGDDMAESRKWKKQTTERKKEIAKKQFRETYEF